MGGITDILGKVVTIEMFPRGEKYWEEYVGKLTFCFDNRTYYLSNYIKYICKRVKKRVKRVAVESGDVIVLRANIQTIRLNPKPMNGDKKKIRKIQIRNPEDSRGIGEIKMYEKNL